jgi:hypothetical protein
VTLDPASAISSRSELNLNSGAIQVSQDGIDWGEAQIKAFLAEQLYGETLAEYRVPNRVVTIPLGLGMGGVPEHQEESRRKLSEKVALLQRQGGVLMRQREGGVPMYADVMTATLTMPDKWGETGYVEPGVTLKLECLPDFYGEEIELDVIEGTGQLVGVLNKSSAQAVIAGDYPARARLVLTEGEGQIQRSLIWGLRSTRYDAAETAKLFYDAKEMTALNNAKEEANASTYSGTAIKLTAPVVNAWHPFLETFLATPKKQLTHIGTYRVWARVIGTVGQQVRLQWSNAFATAVSTNEAVRIAVTGIVLLDLGEVRIEEPPVGEHFWRGLLAVETGSVTHAIEADRLWLQPLDDGAGKARATAPTVGTIAPAAVPATVAEGVNEEPWTGEGTAATWENIANVTSTTLTAHAHLTEPVNHTRPIKCTACGFALPTGVTVKGIEVRVKMTSSVGAATLRGKLWKGANVGSGREVSNFAAGTKTAVLGGSSDLWGLTPTATEINEATFGVQIGFANTQYNQDIYVGALTITVYWAYTGVSTPEDAVLNASRKTHIRFDGSYREDLSDEAYVRISEETGDLFRLPPSGLENRAVQLIVKQSRHLMPGVSGEPGEDNGIDKIKGQVFYRPCYIERP